MTELRLIARRALILAGAVACAGAQAQAPAAPSQSASSNAASDKAQKETDRTLYWIRVLAEKPAPKAAAPKPVAAAPTPPKPAAVAAEPRAAERVKVASNADSSNAAPASVVTPVPAPAPAATQVAAAAAAPSLANGGKGRVASVASSGGLDAGVSSPAVAGAGPAVTGALAAPTLTPPPAAAEEIAAPEVDEPDPGLIMTKSADPQFSMATMRRLRKGEVEVRFEVGPDGQVDVVSVVKTTNPSLNSAALDAVRQWQFKPTPHGHTAVVDLAFNLDS